MLRALVAASGVVALLGEGVELAEDALAKAREAVDVDERGPENRRMRARALAKVSRQAFAAWAGPTRSGVPTNPAHPLAPATGARDADAAKDAVMAACSAAGSYANVERHEAKRLASNALRFATVASGGEVGWDVTLRPCHSCGGPAEVVDAAPPGESGDVLRCPICDGTSVQARLVRELRRLGYRLTFSPDGQQLLSVNSVAVTVEEDTGMFWTTVSVVVERERLFSGRFVDDADRVFGDALSSVEKAVLVAGGGKP